MVKMATVFLEVLTWPFFLPMQLECFSGNFLSFYGTMGNNSDNKIVDAEILEVMRIHSGLTLTYKQLDFVKFKHCAIVSVDAFVPNILVIIIFSGHLAERTNLRHFLTFGMIGTGIFTALFGFGRYWNIHALWFYVIVQVSFEAIYQFIIPIRHVCGGFLVFWLQCLIHFLMLLI